jgi:hypothetical protein
MEPKEYEEENEEDEEGFFMEAVERTRAAIDAGSDLDEAVSWIDNPNLAAAVSSELYGYGEEDDDEETDDD